MEFTIQKFCADIEIKHKKHTITETEKSIALALMRNREPLGVISKLRGILMETKRNKTVKMVDTTREKGKRRCAKGSRRYRVSMFKSIFNRCGGN